jgi:hypothetical protein
MKRIVYSLLGLLLIQCTSDNKNKEENLGLGVFFCDAEDLNSKGNKFYSSGTEFGGSEGRTSEESFEGEYSCAVDTSSKYGMAHIFKDLKPLETFNISVYRKSKDFKGLLVVQSLSGSFYKSQMTSFQKKDANGWDVLSISMQLPQNVDSLKGLKIYVFNGEKDGRRIYFDNLRVERFSLMESDTLEINNNAFNIGLTDYDYQSIKGFRERAIADGVISKKVKKEFSGYLKYYGKTYRIDIRLKGDWTDHLQGHKWSYRISVKDGQTIMGLKSFSIQSPKVRDYLQEWVIHQVCDMEGVLTTNFDYVPVLINGIDFGLYNVEEHFEKQLLESRNRREGPILKFDDDGYWESNLYKKEFGVFPNKPFFEASTISSFKMKKTMKSKKLRSQFLIAQNLMLKYKNGDPNIDQFIDVDQFAKTIALMGLGNVNHSYIWHNQRFYYNPVSSKLELIVYDCYSRPGNSLSKEIGIAGNLPGNKHSSVLADYAVKNILGDTSFQKQYLKYLKKFSSKEYVSNLIADLTSEIDSLSKEIKEEYHFYNYDYSFLEGNAKKIREDLLSYESKIKGVGVSFTLKNDIEKPCVSADPFKHISLNAYLKEVKTNGSVILSLQNYHCKAIKIVGYSTKQFPDSILNVSKKFTLGSFPGDKKTYNLSLKEKPKKLFYSVVGDVRDTLFSSKIIPWPIPTTEIPYAEMSKPLRTNAKEYDLEGKVITFKKGKHVVKENIVIPSGMIVIFEPGAELVFDKETFLMSYSAVQMIGSQKETIKISSTDGTGGGFTVLEAETTSYLRNVVFDGLNTFNQSGWTLTGAVTFYESNVEIDSVVFTNNKCEDGLNIVRSNFSLSNSEISNTFSDGFDADFCEGTVLNCSFLNTGNDCLDFSGSKVSIGECNLTQSGDKGISCGEQSQVKIDNVFINGAVLGIASKDNSEVKVKTVRLKNCKTGFSVFQKKSEYGPASIFVDGYELIGVEVLSDVESGSKLELKNKIESISTLESYVKKIKADKKWMESIKLKAKKRNISVEEMVEIDAKYALKKNS